VLRNPYIVGVERFETPVFSSSQSAYRIEQAAHFCLLLWQQFQPELRTMRYTLTCDHDADSVKEFAQPPHYDELIAFDMDDAQQIDIEFISQQPAATRRDLQTHLGQGDEHFPAFLEVFIPLPDSQSQPRTASPRDTSNERLVIWCRPNLLPKVTALWERAAAMLANQS